MKKKTERRRQIISAAKELISERGYSTVTTREISSAAGISKGGLYDYFSTKEELFVAVLQDEIHETIKEFIDAVGKSESTDNTLALIKDYSKKSIKESNCYYLLLFDFIVSCRRREQINELFKPVNYDLRNQLFTIMKNLFTNTNKDDAYCYGMTDIIIAFGEGMFLQSVTGQSSENINAAIDQFWDHMAVIIENERRL